MQQEYEIVTKILEKLSSKKKKAEGFMDKYRTRNMPEPEEYYKGVCWSFDYAIKVVKESFGEEDSQ